MRSKYWWRKNGWIIAIALWFFAVFFLMYALLKA